MNNHQSSVSAISFEHAFGAQDETLARDLCAELDRSGIVRLPSVIPSTHLASMQRAFRRQLSGLRWNDYDGYEKTEPNRHMIEDVLTLDPGFVATALHPVVKRVLRLYLGERFELVEAKGWRSLPTKKDFHGWHGDAWYDQEGTREIPREVKLAFYLTDVTSGAFNYLKASHRQQAPRPIRTAEIGDLSNYELIEMAGAAGTAFLFDTSGIHRQGVPILDPREAVFLNYHDPDVPLQREDVQFYRYHPLLLNAAFLADLSLEDQKILGFGNLRNYQSDFSQPDRHPVLHKAFGFGLNTSLRCAHLVERIKARLRLLKNR
jgi:hypothetical protein